MNPQSNFAYSRRVRDQDKVMETEEQINLNKITINHFWSSVLMKRASVINKCK